MDIEKLSVYDPRVVQPRPRYAVDKGGLSVTNSPFSAIAATSSQMSFNIQAPSLNVYMDRKIEWTTEVDIQFTTTVANPSAFGVQPAGGADPTANAIPVVVFGRDVALAAHPLHALVSTMTATINDAVVSQNTADVLYEVARLVDMGPSKLQRTTPTYLDKYQLYNAAVGAINNPLGSYFDGTDYENLPNGCFYNVKFTDSAGADLVAVKGGSYVVGGVTYNTYNGVPVITSALGVNIGAYPIFIRFQATEKLFLSPFIWNEAVGDEVGLFGLNNCQLVFNFGDPSRVIRNAPLAAGSSGGLAISRTVSAVAFRSSSPFNSAKVNCIFITPPLDINLPSRSVLPYLEFPRYVSSPLIAVGAGASSPTLISNTITLPVMPDMFIIYAKPLYSTVATTLGVNSSTLADFYLPITQISINLDNYSGLLASHTTEQLYGISTRNGLRMDWNTWSGRGKVVALSAGGATTIGNLPAQVPLVGGFLVLKPGVDIPLQAGQAPGVVSNYTFQFNCTCYNPASVSVTPQLYVIAVNSGFFETQAGSSRIIRGVLTEQDVIQAPPASAAARSEMERIVGGGFLSKLGSALTRAVSMAKSASENPLVQAGVRAAAARSGNPLLQQAASMLPAGRGVAGGAAAMPRGGRRTGGRRAQGADMAALM